MRSGLGEYATIARTLEREHAELLETLQDIADDLQQSNGGNGPNSALNTHLLLIARAVIAKAKGE